MKAKYGKISIGCFIASLTAPPIIGLFIFKGLGTIGIRVSIFPSGLLLIYLGLILILSGFFLGLVGLIKKETPRIYSIIGLGLSTALIAHTFVTNSGGKGLKTECMDEKGVRRHAKKYLAMRDDVDDAVRQSILVGKVTIGMFPDEAIAAGGPCRYTFKTDDGSSIMDGGSYISGGDSLRAYFYYVEAAPPSPRRSPDLLWTQRTEPMTNLIITMTFFNRTQFDTEYFVNTRVHFDAGRVSSIEKVEEPHDYWRDPRTKENP